MTLGRPPGLSDDPHVLNHYRTSLTAALNLLKHFGVSEIVLIGADNGPVAGKTHHHVEHPWPLRKNCWEEQREELASTVEPLKRAGIKVVNASMKSRLTFWEKQPLEGILNNAGNSQG